MMKTTEWLAWKNRSKVVLDTKDDTGYVIAMSWVDGAIQFDATGPTLDAALIGLILTMQHHISHDEDNDDAAV
jgi:hypothetical protein